MFVGSNRNTPHKMNTKHTLVMRHDKDGNVRQFHTPGPWEVDRFYWTIQRRLFGSDEPEVEVFGRLTNGEHAEANARLIAAAPELLEELRKCRNVIAHCISELPQAYKEAARTQMNKAGEAIAKATNETL